MQHATALLTCTLLAAVGCGNAEQEGRLAAQRAAAEEAKREAARGEVAPRMRAPVQDSRKVECSQLIDAAAFTEALEEKAPITVRDTRKANADAAAACSLVRGGRPLTTREQEALIKRTGKLGVLAGDELCHIAAFCTVHTDDEALRKRCTGSKKRHDDSLGHYACETTVQHGAIDVISLRFLEPDTGCALEVRGGPSIADNDFIRRCAKAARALIGQEQIAEQAPQATGEPVPGAP